MNTEDAIRTRRTLKVRVDPEHPLPVIKGDEFMKTMEELIELGAQAPFHYESAESQRSGSLQGIEPWRFHALDGDSCRKVLDAFNQNKPQKAPDGIKQMLAAADGLILGTWLPERTRKLSKKFHPNLKNMEHIAATGAAIQNILLAATARGLNAYWSSGGILRKPKVLQFLGIPEHEILLGAIFLFPDEIPESAQTKTGKHAESRGKISDYSDWIKM
ncbi:nitroreductase family protein [Gracilimonas tropica]|uniref:nitroreductase family protein n=1 Tax=Gracilimonas tropica TaxID=454600 RepID=UPI0003792319|nr:nitroreductase family protein [Gracilimonas tropica]